MKAPVNLIKKINLPGLASKAKAAAKMEVLVGIPQEQSSREHGGEINNAELLYVHTHGVRAASMRAEMQQSIEHGTTYSKAHSLYIQTHGSPLWHVPPRPVLEPAIEANKDKIARELKKVITAGIKNDKTGVKAGLHRAGLVAENAAKRWFENPMNGWPPNSPVTAAKKGSSIPLVDTGELRKAITHVIRENGV